MNFDISWPLAMLSIAGTIFNVKKKIACFYIWALGEILWIFLDCHDAQYGRMFLDVVHLGMAVWGIYSWSKKCPENLKKFEFNGKIKEKIRRKTREQ